MKSSMKVAAVAALGFASIAVSAASAGKFIAAGYFHTCGIRESGTVDCWGDNNDGQSTPPDGKFIAVSAGKSMTRTHTCGIRESGTVDCWGSEGSRQSMPPGGKFIAVNSVGHARTCGIRESGTVVCNGVIGASTPPEGAFSAISVGFGFACGIRESGTVDCWGSEGSRQSMPPGGKFITVSAGRFHTCGIRESGSAVLLGFRQIWPVHAARWQIHSLMRMRDMSVTAYMEPFHVRLNGSTPPHVRLNGVTSAVPR